MQKSFMIRKSGLGNFKDIYLKAREILILINWNLVQLILNQYMILLIKWSG